MSKRGATSDLNHDNWDRDEDPEDSGTFEKAPQEVIKKRTIKIAKRRNPISTQNDDSKSNVFGGFTGFSKTTTTSNSNDTNTNNNKTTFGFLSNLTEKSNDNEVQANGTPTNDKKSDEYYAKLKGLNESVLAWIKKHVTENPLINLQPIFKDYDRYFAELEKLKDTTTITTSTTIATSIPPLNFGSSNTSTTTAATLPKFSFGSSAPAKFSFGTSSTTAPTSASFSFGSKSSSLSSTATASFSTSSGNSPTPNELTTTTTTKPSIFGSTSPTTKPISSSTIDNKTNDDNENEASDEPPKVEFTPVVEKDHIYSIRCKLFVKKDGNFGDRGVGTLYLKTIPDNEKVQLIVRADTNLGNLLCNFILSESIPIKRMGKKDVMLVCLPTPEYKPPPIPILLRVKSPEEADELLNTLEKHKK